MINCHENLYKRFSENEQNRENNKISNEEYLQEKTQILMDANTRDDICINLLSSEIKRQLSIIKITDNFIIEKKQFDEYQKYFSENFNIINPLEQAYAVNIIKFGTYIKEQGESLPSELLALYIAAKQKMAND